MLLSGKKVDDLALMYNLLSRVKNGLLNFKTAFASYIKVKYYNLIKSYGFNGKILLNALNIFWFTIYNFNQLNQKGFFSC